MPAKGVALPPSDLGALDHAFRPGVERERRKQSRASLSWPVRLFRLNSEAIVETTTRDISSLGFYFLSPVMLDVSEAALCILILPVHDPRCRKSELPLHCKIRVVRVDPEARPGMTGIACRIENYSFPPTDGAASG